MTKAGNCEEIMEMREVDADDDFGVNVFGVLSFPGCVSVKVRKLPAKPLLAIGHLDAS